MTIADLLIFHEATNVEVYNIDLGKWKNIEGWYNRMLQIKEIKEIHIMFRKELPDFLNVLNQVTIEQ